MALFAGSSPALAQSLTCATLNDTPLPAINSAVNVTLEPGDEVAVSPGSGSSAMVVEGPEGYFERCGFIYNLPACAGANGVFVAEAAGVYTFEKTGGPLQDTLTCTSASGTGGNEEDEEDDQGGDDETDTGGDDTGGDDTGGEDGDELAEAIAEQRAAQATGAAAATAASTGNIGRAISIIANRTGNNSAVTRNGVFLSTSGGASMPSAWAALQGRSFTGDLEGRSYELTLGADIEPNPGTRFGFVLSAGRADLTFTGTDIETDSVTYGPYFSASLSDRYSIDGFVLFASPEYDVGGTTYSADRRAIGLSVSADYTLGGMQIISSLGVQGFEEEHPAAGALAARTIRQTTGSLSVQANLAPGSATQPYIRLGLNNNRFDDGTTESTFWAPRLGGGINWQTGAGTLSLDIDGGRLLEDTNDLGFDLRYSINF